MSMAALADSSKINSDSKKEVKLKVAEASQDDVNRGVVRLDSAIMKDLGINQGSVVELEGSRKTVAIAARAFPADIGLAIIRMDGLVRRNAGASISEYVTIRPCQVKAAKTISLAAHYGEDALVLIDQLRSQPLFQEIIATNQETIYAGIHIFHGRRLVDARQSRQALVQFWQAYRIHPPSAVQMWYKILQAMGGMVGLSGLFLAYRDLRRRMQNGVRRLKVDHRGAYWV